MARLQEIQPSLDVNLEELNTERNLHIVELIEKFNRVFSTNNVSPGGAKGVEHRIDTGKNRPFNTAPRRISPKEREIVEKLTEEMLASGVCSKSNSPWSSPEVLVPKKDGANRFLTKCLKRMVSRSSFDSMTYGRRTTRGQEACTSLFGLLL